MPWCWGDRGHRAEILLESTLVRHDVSGNLIDRVVRQGRLNKGMPPFPDFSAAQISDIAAYLHARVRVTTGADDTGPVGGDQSQQLLTGNVGSREAVLQWGREMRNLSFSDRRSRWNREEVFSARPGVEIPLSAGLMTSRPPCLAFREKIKGKLLHLDGFYVAILNTDGWYRSWPLQKVKVQVADSLAAHLQLLHEYTDKDIHNVFSYLETLK